MHSLDLIPQSWRDRVRARRWVRAGIALGAGLAVAAFALRHGLELSRTRLAAEVAQLRATQQDLTKNKALLARLRLDRVELQHRVEWSAALRTAVTVEPLFVALDRAYAEGVNFQELRLARVPPAAPAPVDARAAAASRPSAPAGARVTIRGIVASEAALAEFVERLNREAVFTDLRAQDGGERDAARAFSLDAVLAARKG